MARDRNHERQFSGELSSLSPEIGDAEQRVTDYQVYSEQLARVMLNLLTRIEKQDMLSVIESKIAEKNALLTPDLRYKTSLPPEIQEQTKTSILKLEALQVLVKENLATTVASKNPKEEPKQGKKINTDYVKLPKIR